MIRVANKRADAVGEYVGRPSPLGNPFVLRHESERARVIAEYEVWLRSKITEQDQRVCDELRRLLAIARQGDLTLVCWCAPKPCHADVIKRLLEEQL